MKRKAEFFIITTVLVSGSLLMITNLMSSGAEMDYTSVLSQHDTEMVENVAQRAESAWWHQNWTYRTAVVAEEQHGNNLVGEAFSVIINAHDDWINDDCSDIRVIQDGEPQPWVPQTSCDVDTYESRSDAIARYKLDEASGSRANDSTPNSHDGTLRGDPDWVSGKYGTGLRFDGSGDYVEIPGDRSLDPGNVVTVSTWFRPETLSPGSEMTLFDRGAGYTMFINTAGQLVFRVDSTTRRGTQSFAAFHNLSAANAWYHAVGTYDGDELRLYVDGERRDDLTHDGSIDAAGNSSAAIGATPNGTREFQGTVDDVRVYDRSFNQKRARGEYLNGVELLVTADVPPMGRTGNLHVYYGNAFAEDAPYSTYYMNRSEPDNPQLIKTGIPRSQEEVMANVAQGVRDIDQNTGASLNYQQNPDDCNVVTLRATRSAFEREVCNVYTGKMRNIPVSRDITARMAIATYPDNRNVAYWTAFNYLSQEYELYYSTDGDLDAEQGPYTGDIRIVEDAYTVKGSERTPVIIAKNDNPEQGWTFNLTENGTTHRFRMNGVPGAAEDHLVFWEERYNPAVSQPREPDDWMDEVLRVSFIPPDTYRVALYNAKGAHRHEVYNIIDQDNPLQGNLIFSKSQGQSYSNYQGGWFLRERLLAN